MSFKPILRFAVMSDLHYSEEHAFVRDRFKNTMRFIYDYCERSEYKALDALYAIGDFTDLGYREQMQMFKDDTVTAVKDSTKLIVTTANHELHYLPEPLDYTDAQGYFSEIFDMPFDQHLVMNGYHLISISNTFNGGPWHDSFTDEKKAFLRDELVKARDDDPKKPIFVLQHTGIKGTTPGGNFGNNEIHSILIDFPQVIDFSGHSHYAANDPMEIHQKHFTSVSTGSLLNIGGINNDKHKCYYPGSNNYAHCLLVEVDALSRTRIRVIDAVAPGFFENDYIIEEPYDITKFKYTMGRIRTAAIPYFTADAAGTLAVSGGKVKLTFPQAKIDEYRVREYIVSLHRKSDGAALAQRSLWSGSAALNMPETLSTEFEDIACECYAKVVAMSFFDMTSAPFIVEN